jgi:hypothetical protein
MTAALTVGGFIGFPPFCWVVILATLSMSNWLGRFRWSWFAGDDGDRVNQLPMALRRDHPSQEVQKIGGEERVTGKILETEGRPFHDVNLPEAHVEKLF